MVLAVTVNENVVEVDDDKFFDERLEDLMHDAYECARCVGEAERHHQPFV